ncbi:hypothetical protein OFC55_38240, partial [Escherichia coli]|nr:hypothetical protein [Escherichia coli]
PIPDKFKHNASDADKKIGIFMICFNGFPLLNNITPTLICKQADTTNSSTAEERAASPNV